MPSPRARTPSLRRWPRWPARAASPSSEEATLWPRWRRPASPTRCRTSPLEEVSIVCHICMYVCMLFHTFRTIVSEFTMCMNVCIHVCFRYTRSFFGAFGGQGAARNSRPWCLMHCMTHCGVHLHVVRTHTWGLLLLLETVFFFFFSRNSVESKKTTSKR